jgi:predicted dehydrogenase
MQTARRLLREGAIGEIVTATVHGQHPLSFRSGRPDWYFEEGQHGGTINDIAVHAVDLIPWVTGLTFAEINAARCWNSFAEGMPSFRDAGQMMLTMDNGCGVLGDVSYSAPDSSGYVLPFYWRMTFWGQKGVTEASVTSSEIALALNGESGVRSLPLAEGNPGGYLRSFLRDIQGGLGVDELDTAQVLRAARTTLMIQRVADLDLRGQRLSPA